MADRSTWVKLDRNIIKWRWYRSANTVRVFIHLILTANIEDHDFENVVIHRGELATSLRSLNEQLGISTQSVRTALEHLKTTGEITCKSYNKFQVISIEKYDQYQMTLTSKSTANQQATNNQLTNNQQANNTQTTNNQQQSKNIRNKEVKNEKNMCVDPPTAETHKKSPSANEVIGYFAVKGRSRQDAEKFFTYNQARNWKMGRTRIADWQSVADMWIAGNPDTSPPAGYDPHPELDDFGRPIQPKYK